MKFQLLAVAVASILSTSVFAQSDLESDKDKLSYGLGMVVGERILKTYGDLDYDILREAMEAQVEGNETKMSIAEAQELLQAQQAKVAEEQAKLAAERAEVAKEEGAKYLEENATKDSVTVTDSGLQYEVLTEGDGASPEVTDTVSVHYVGTLLDGTEFDSSVARGSPAQFPLGNVIKGWTEGVQLMKVGSKFKFTIPSDLAYGTRGAPPSIGPDETLVFEIELLEIMGK